MNEALGQFCALVTGNNTLRLLDHVRFEYFLKYYFVALRSLARVLFNTCDYILTEHIIVLSLSIPCIAPHTFLG